MDKVVDISKHRRKKAIAMPKHKTIVSESPYTINSVEIYYPSNLSQDQLALLMADDDGMVYDSE